MLRILIGLVVIASLPGAMNAQEQPNIVVLVSDDHGYGDVGWSNPAVRTPHLDRLAQQGVRLDRFYANPICSVTRAALMTGLASLRTGVNNSSGLDLKYRILPQYFHDAGYQTWMCGKWHLGGAPDSQRSGPEYMPHARGFEYFYGHLHGAIDYVTHRRKDRDEIDWQRNGVTLQEEGFSTDLLADDAIRLIRERDKDRPFLLYLAFNAVHGPLQSPPSASELSRRDRRPMLLANVTHLDAAIGRVLQCLDTQGLSENTLVVFFGDNGGQLSQGSSNGELRGEKGTVFEGGIRVPAVIRWTGRLPAGKTSQQWMCVTDLLPTLASAANLQTHQQVSLDGVDLWKAIQTADATPRPPFVMGNRDVACLDEPWKLVISGQGEPALLYHLHDDPTEKSDLAAEHPDVVAKLSRIVNDLQPQGRRGTRQGGGQTRPDRARNNQDRKMQPRRGGELK